MGILKMHKIDRVYHYSPLHYLPFIGRSMALLSKPSLQRAGFQSNHLRSMSSHHDMARGFADFTHLTLDRYPRILKAKLAAGFPHIGLAVPAYAVEANAYSLCRFNVAMTRYLRRDGKPGFPESPSNGRYYGQQQIPTARTDDDKEAMLNAHLHSDTIIEVLIHGDLALPKDTAVACYEGADAQLIRKILAEIGLPWATVMERPSGPYPRSSAYARAVMKFVERALADSEWRGDGLEFDRV